MLNTIPTMTYPYTSRPRAPAGPAAGGRARPRARAPARRTPQARPRARRARPAAARRRRGAAIVAAPRSSCAAGAAVRCSALTGRLGGARHAAECRSSARMRDRRTGRRHAAPPVPCEHPARTAGTTACRTWALRRAPEPKRVGDDVHARARRVAREPVGLRQPAAQVQLQQAKRGERGVGAVKLSQTMGPGASCWGGREGEQAGEHGGIGCGAHVVKVRKPALRHGQALRGTPLLAQGRRGGGVRGSAGSERVRDRTGAAARAGAGAGEQRGPDRQRPERDCGLGVPGLAAAGRQDDRGPAAARPPAQIMPGPRQITQRLYLTSTAR